MALTGVLTTTSRRGQRLDREALCDNAALTGVLTTTSRHGQRLDREALCDNAALTGVLTTTSRHGQRLDREAVCDNAALQQQQQCVLSFHVVVQPYFQLVKVSVEVVDVNDNAPVIELAVGGTQLYESAELTTELHVASARDADSQRHGIDSCRLDNTIQSVDTAMDTALDTGQAVDTRKSHPSSQWTGAESVQLTVCRSSRWWFVDVSMTLESWTCTCV